MASYFDKLREGIEERDWYKVADAYFGMTGVKIVIQDYEDTEEEEEVILPPPSKKPVKLKKSVPQRGRVQPEDDVDRSIARKTVAPLKKGNLFVDTLEHDKHLIQSKTEKKKWVRPDLGRQPAKMARVVCSGCHQDAFVDVTALAVSKNIDDSETVNYDYCCGNCLAKGKR